MKTDIDELMQQADLDALLVVGSASNNPEMVYFTGLIHLSDDRIPSFLLKKRSEPPILFHHAMERDEAAQSGLAKKSLADYGLTNILEGVGGDGVRAASEVFSRAIDEFDVRGRVGLYGKSRLGPRLGAINLLLETGRPIEVVGEPFDTSVLTKARTTKASDEVERIREMGAITTAVVGDVAEFLTSHHAKDGLLIDSRGEVLTIGEVKRRINLWIAMRGADNPLGTIFAAGRDSGVPHSVGQADQPVPVGKTIIFDIFPTESGGGYFYDFTRTWCLGRAPEAAEALYQDVLEVYDSVLERLEVGKPCRDFQIMTCQEFAKRGHPTILDTPETTDGYNHSLGHGLGLDVHEAPAFSHLELNDDLLAPGSVFTFEPGLYYPERGMGVRLEDTLWARPDGELELLAEFPKDLVLKVPGA